MRSDLDQLRDRAPNLLVDVLVNLDVEVEIDSLPRLLDLC